MKRTALRNSETMDIVKELRRGPPSGTYNEIFRYYREWTNRAADAIERLQAENRALREHDQNLEQWLDDAK